jgi:hypothetical protein
MRESIKAPVVKTFIKDELKDAIKNSPKIIQEYIRALKDNSKRWEDIVQIAKDKIKELQKELDTLKKLK